MAQFRHTLNGLPKALLGVIFVLFSRLVFADVAILVDQGVLVETDPQPEVIEDTGDEIPEEEEGAEPEPEPEVGARVDAEYISIGGWAVTGATFIDAATYVFDFGNATEVTAATLTIPIRDVLPQNDAAPVEVTFFSDNGVIEVTDYSIGFTTPIAEVDAALLTELVIDVTGAVNAALNTGQFVGFRITSAVAPGSVDTTLFPPYTGIRLEDNPLLEFVPGPAPLLANDVARFDGFTLQVPEIEVPTVGEATAEFKLVDPNELIFELTQVSVSEDPPAPPPLSGAELFNCSAFTQPDQAGIAEGVSNYSVNSGILDVPSVNLNGEQVTVRLEHIEGSAPARFETLTLGVVQSGPSDATVSALQGGLLVEPSQDFVSLCHGWVLIGDFIRNRIVERNIISGETGATYPFNTAPDQFTLDRANNRVFMTVFPESERLYSLNLETGDITFNALSQTLGNGMGFNYTYGFALRDIALGEDGNVFAIMFDGEGFNPENGVPFSDSQLWMGLMDPSGNFLVDSIPLEEPIRIEYDPVLDHVFLATESNLATFNFNAGTNVFTFVQGTDVPVGSGCTDFDISPDGTRLAYACPDGNYPEQDFSIADMDPESYFNNDGAWFFGTSPVSATFNADGTLLVGTDNDKLYIFDVKTHLILEDFELGLLEGESIKKVRLSADGGLIYVFLNNENRAENSKFYWMDMPPITGTPL